METEKRLVNETWINNRELNAIVISVRNEDGDFVAKIPSHWNNAKENARLIMALPELFNALSDLIQVKDWKDKYGKGEHYSVDQPVAWENARNAINKALGK